MSMIGAFSRSRIAIGAAGGKGEVAFAMTKWWKKKTSINGEVIMSLSMNEQHHIVPWIKTWPKKVIDRFPTYLWPIGAFGAIFAIIEWGDARDHAEDYAHRY